MSTEKRGKTVIAFIIADRPEEVSGILHELSARGISGQIFTPDEALEKASTSAPDLAIVSEHLANTTGPRVIQQLLERSWQISTILVSDKDEEILHDETEGLGILGSIKSFDDKLQLNRLLDTFSQIASLKPSQAQQ
jgi:DNA-binding NarL/FixJ family response regulator